MFTLPAQRQLPNLVIASPQGRAGAALAAPDGARPGPPVRAALPARRRASACPSVEPDGAADRAGRGAARGPRPAVRRLRPDRRRGRSRSPTRSRPRAGRSASSTPGSPSRSTAQLILDAGARQAARRDVRGERRDRRLRGGGPRGARGGAAGRSGATATSRCASSASPATGSWTTAPWRTCAALIRARRRRASTAQVAARRSAQLGIAGAGRQARLSRLTTAASAVRVARRPRRCAAR